jgi:hypothetical protein
MVIDTVGEVVCALREAKLVIFSSVAQGTMASGIGIEPCVHKSPAPLIVDVNATTGDFIRVEK